ncbi:ATP-binding protein [Mesoaciditoga sp.]
MLFSFYVNLASSIANGLMLLYSVRYHIYSKKSPKNFYSIFMTTVFLIWNASEFFRIFGKVQFQLLSFSLFSFLISIAIALMLSSFLDIKKMYWLEFFFLIVGSVAFFFYAFTSKNLSEFSTVFFTLNSSVMLFCLVWKYFQVRSFSVRNKIILNALYYLGFFSFEAIVVWSYYFGPFSPSYLILTNSLILSVYLYMLMSSMYGNNVSFSANFFKNALYGGLVAFIISVFFTIGYYVDSYFAGKVGTVQSFFINFVLVFFLFLAFNGFFKKIDIVLEKFTKTGTYYYRESMMNFMRKVLSIDNLEELSVLVSNYMLKVLNSSTVEIFFKEDDGTFISAKRKIDGSYFNSIPKFTKVVDLYAISKKPKFLKGKEFLVWIKSVDKIEGCMILGCKRFGRYTPSDLEVVDIISNQIALFFSRYRSIERVRKAERNLFLQEKMASLGRLAFGVAHEIRNPLNVISTSLQIIDEEPQQSKKLRKYIQEEIERINGLLENFLDFARQKPKSVEMVNINEIVQKTVLLLKESALKKDVEVIESVPQQPIYAKIDKNMMMEVLLNLGTNALDAVGEGGKIWFELKRNGDSFYVHVSNNGKPIPEEDREKIFEPFYTTKAHGSGLGLSIVYNYIQNMGGTVYVESDASKTTFTVHLPLEVKN